MTTFLSMTEAAQFFTHHAHRSLVVAHENPDLDAIGSGAAVVHLAHQMGREAWLTYPSTTPLPEGFSVIPGADECIPSTEIPEDIDCVIVVDCGSDDRMGELAPLLDTVPHSLVIDHHRSNAGFGEYAVVYETCDATAVMIVELADALGIPLTRDIAIALYAGILGDTRGLAWAKPQTLRIAARLLEYSFDQREISRNLLSSHHFPYLGQLAAVLTQAEYYPDDVDGRGWVVAHIPHEELITWDVGDAQTVVPLLSSITEAEVALVLREVSPDTWVGSLRSHSDVNVSEVARALGGGGHRRAAGFTLHGTYNDVLSTVRTLLTPPPLWKGDHDTGTSHVA